MAKAKKKGYVPEDAIPIHVKSDHKRAWESHLERLTSTVIRWLHDRKIELEDDEPKELQVYLATLLVPVETNVGIQLMSPDALPGSSEEKPATDCPFADELVREAHERKAELLAEARSRSMGDRRFLAEKLGLAARGFDVEFIERLVDYNEAKGSYFNYVLRLSAEASVALGPPEDAINQGKVRAALAQVGHVLQKKSEGEWTQIAQTILDGEVACRLRWSSGEETLQRAVEHPVPIETEEAVA